MGFTYYVGPELEFFYIKSPIKKLGLRRVFKDE